MNSRRVNAIIIRIGLISLGMIVSFAPRILAVDRLLIDQGSDTAYMPYRLSQLQYQDYSARTRAQFRPIQPLRLEIPGRQVGVVIKAGNPDIATDNPATFPKIRYDDWTVIKDNAIPFIANDWRVFHEPLTGRAQVVGVGYKRDSAWVFLLDPDSGIQKQAYLCSGSDGTGDGRWDPLIRFMLLDDYDFDGKQEGFIYVNSEREQGPRELFCVEIRDLSIDWSLPIASPPFANNFLNIDDSLNPGIVLTTNNPGHGRHDANFNDGNRYFTAIDSRGFLVAKRLLAKQHICCCLLPALVPNEFYVTHELNNGDLDTISSHTSDINYLSLIDREGNLLKTAGYAGKPLNTWTDSYGEYHFAVFLKTADYRVRVYDSDLNLVAVSDPVRLGDYLGTISILDEPEAGRIFSDGIYLKNAKGYKRIAAFPFGPEFVAPLAIDSLRNVLSVVLTTTSRYMVVEICKRSNIELLSIFYHRNQPYVLMALSGLLVGLVATNYFRRRTNHNLKLIAEQKLELERAHRELAEAQEKLVAAEKFQQAKDIAGGFAHEIRNALFPADGLLTKLLELECKTDHAVHSPESLLRETKQAVANAITITELIRDYTKLDVGRMTEKVDLGSVFENSIKNHRRQIKDMGVQVEVDGDKGVRIETNRQHLEIVFNNLILNSLDALKDNPDPRISLSWMKNEGFVDIDFQDNGIGIPVENLKRVFDLFYSTKPDTGTGIGLSMVKKITQMYEGEISATSEPGRGTTFNIRLKCA